MAYTVFPIDPMGGFLIDSQGNKVNIVDLLGKDGLIDGWVHDPRTFEALGLCVVGSDGKTYNLADMLKNSGRAQSELPEPSEGNVGLIVQYSGETTDELRHGYFYECVENDGEYVWSPMDFGATPVAEWSGDTLVITS